MRHEEGQVRLGLLREAQADGRREAAQEGRDRLAVDVVEVERLLRLLELQHRGGHHLPAVRLGEQADADGDVEGQFRRLEDRGRRGLREREGVALGGRVVAAARLHHGRAGLGVPPLELGEVEARGVGHGGAEVVAGDGLPVVPSEVQVHALWGVRLGGWGLVNAGGGWRVGTEQAPHVVGMPAPSVCLSVCLPACLPVCLSVCLSACLPVCLPACLSICLPVHPNPRLDARRKRKRTLRKRWGPRRVWYMRITSAPFSYTVAV